jgi:hypothetical protein
MNKKIVQVIYKCFSENLEGKELEDYLEKERKRVEDSLNVDDKIKYNVTILPTQNMYNTVETLPLFN